MTDNGNKVMPTRASVFCPTGGGGGGGGGGAPATGQRVSREFVPILVLLAKPTVLQTMIPNTKDGQYAPVSFCCAQRGEGGVCLVKRRSFQVNTHNVSLA